MTSKISKLAIAVLLAAALSGCIPLVVGGFIGYKMAESDAHNEFCAHHVDDASCHP